VVENELKRYGAILWHWVWLIILGTLLGAGAAYVSSRLTTPVYAASTTLLISEAPSSGKTADYASILTSERLAQTYSAMMTKRPVMDEVAKSLGLVDMPSDALARRVSVNLVRDTQLVVLQVENEDPALAANLANAIPAEFARQNAALQAGRYADSKANLSKEIDSLKEQIAAKQSEINALGTTKTPATDAELSRLNSELTQLRQSSAYLLQSYESIRLAETQSTNNIVVVEPAEEPAVPVRPRTFQNTLLGAVVGLLLATGIVFLIEYLDDRVRSPEQIDTILKLPVVGLIARMPSTNLKGRAGLIAVREPRSPIVEAFRSLRTNIQFAGVDQPIRTLLVTSAGPSEGKSTVAANLAVVMAQAGLKVVIVDCDLRRPTVHKQFEMPNRAGLTDVMLQDPSQWNGVMQPTGVNNLSIVMSGSLPPNPSELLGSKRMQQFMAHLHESCDMVIIDAPPLLPVTDALVLSPITDGIVMVIDYGGTRIGEALQGKTQLDQIGARILGVVMNKIPTGRRGSYYYYYYNRDYYNEGEGKRRRSRRGGSPALSGTTSVADSSPATLEPSNK
jgi:succinoglycan biosynthesis transport protein ExoP